MAWLTGTEASFTFGGQTLVVANFGSWRMELEKSEASYTPFGFAMERVALGPIRARGVLSMGVDDSATTPIIPDGTAGTLVLKTKTTATAKTYTFRAVLTDLQVAASMAPFDITKAAYGFRATSDVSTDTVTAA